MEVQVEKRKKRVIRGEVALEDQVPDRFKKLKEKEGAAADTVEVPSEEEVEEFFAILRRMKVAVKYFDEKGRGRGKGGKDWREALEQPDVTVDDDDADHELAPAAAAANEIVELRKKDEEVMNEVFDLNAVAPEAAESGGA